MIGIIDYGMGNLRSVEKAFTLQGYDARVTSDLARLESMKALVIPGVGAFPDAMKALREQGQIRLIKDFAASGRPILGICLGMQILFEEGFEGERCDGLGLLKGRVVKLPPGRKIPHMGWNRLLTLKASPILKGIADGTYVYFVHSYYVDHSSADQLVAVTDYAMTLPAVVQRGQVFGLQFHPEKSGDQGLVMIKNFGELSQ